jgi:hypothetical protein
VSNQGEEKQGILCLKQSRICLSWSLLCPFWSAAKRLKMILCLIWSRVPDAAKKRAKQADEWERTSENQRKGEHSVSKQAQFFFMMSDSAQTDAFFKPKSVQMCLLCLIWSRKQLYDVRFGAEVLYCVRFGAKILSLCLFWREILISIDVFLFEREK